LFISTAENENRFFKVLVLLIKETPDFPGFLFLLKRIAVGILILSAVGGAGGKTVGLRKIL